ncbi:MAG: peptidoglycan-binding protein, partial [Litorimonas sp.]
AETRRRIATPARTEERAIPAVTRTVERRVVAQPARTEERVIPAVTRTVTRRVVDAPARVERREIPARFETVEVQRVVTPARTEVIEIPAEFGTIEKRTQTTAQRSEWRQVLCEANANTVVITAIQRRLQELGFYSGALDGRLGQATYAAVEAFQIQRGLSTGGLTLRTVDVLGVDWRSMVSGMSTTTTTRMTTGGSTVTTGLQTGTSTTTTTTTYTVREDGMVIDANGVVLGRYDAATGNVIGSNGQIVIRGLQIGGASSYSINASGMVVDANGAVLGRYDAATGNVIGSNGQIVLRGLQTGLSNSTSGTTTTTTTTTSGRLPTGVLPRARVGSDSSGSVLTETGRSISTTVGTTVGDFTVRADGTVVNGSGAIVGRVNAQGQIIGPNGRVLGRVNP